MATLRELIIKVSANSQSFQTEIARASRMGADYYKTMQNGGRQAAASVRETRRSVAELTDQMESAKVTALGLTGAFAGAFATGHLISLADEWNSVNARLKQASQSTDDFTSSQKQLMDISQKTGTSFSDNANLFSRSAASMREYGYSSSQVLDITEAISTGLKLSGANAQESSSVITQFSQALAQGVLRGEEFNAVNESGDRVIRALAAGMGVARKDLKSMADQGQSTSGGFMINHLTSVETVTRGLEEATSALAVEQERLAQMQAKSESIQSVLEGIENRRIALIRQQAAEQNSAYQSLLMMNGEHTEFNRLLGLGNNLLMARQGLVNAPVRLPQVDLTTQQTAALEKSRRDLALSKLKGEDKERARLGYAADDLGLTNDPQFQTGRQELINNGLNEWRNNQENKPKPKGRHGKTEAEKTEDTYTRLIKQQREQIALSSQNTELARMKYQVTQGELSSLEKSKKETLLHNAALIDQKNIAEQLKTFREGLADSNAAARERGNIDFLGAGYGDKARDRMKEMADIRADFLRQQRDLQRDFSRGQISEDLYKKQTEALKTALAERLDIQEEYYKKTDEQQSDWRAGISDSLMNYADQASDLSSMAATATSEILDATTNSISNNLTSVLTGAASFKDGMSNIFSSLGETVIKTLIQMATQALITKAIMASFGGGAGGLFGSLFGGASGAASVGGAIQSAGANFSFNALGGVYDSPSLSAYSNGVYSTPQYFAFAKGAGVFGEAGPEAIMPLTRGADGSLGVKAVGRESPAVQNAARQQQERQLLSTGDINVNYHLTGKPDDVMMQTLDAHGRRLVKQIKSELTSDVNNPQNAFGRALYSNLQPKKPR
ncbi:phage tail tape measure protein [Klebsiella variicola]|uniref:phage tail tape measure protein n=1 Tax=Klebsiella variicola TaxID=244366 RepID=UPI0018ABBAF7|nr:phage tail tape measure protein [Klebsiella variicola]